MSPAGVSTGRNGKETLLVAVVSLVACGLHLLLVSNSPLFGYHVVDASWHHQWAEMVSCGDLLAYAPFFRAPLYPWFLGLWYVLFGSGAVSGAALSVILTTAGAAVFHRIAVRSMPRYWALAAGLIWALWGTAVFYSSTLLITPLFLLLLLSSFSLLTGPEGRTRTAGWLLLGLACIARPTALLLIPAAWYASGRPTFRQISALVIPIAVVWFSNLVAGDPLTVISSQGGVNLYLGNSRNSDGYTAFAPVPGEIPSDWSFGGELPYVDNVEMASRAAYPLEEDGSAISAEWTGRTLSEIAADPPGWLGLLGRKVLYTLSPAEIPSNYDAYYYRQLSPVMALLLHPPPAAMPMLLLWLLLPGAILAGGGSHELRAAGVFAITLAVCLLPFFVTARMRLPLVPFALLWLMGRASARPLRSLALAPAGAAAGIALALLTRGTILTGGVNMPFHDGVAHYGEGEVQRAEELFLVAIDRAMARDDMDLNGADAMYNLGIISAENGDWEEAAFWWTSAVERDPSHAPSRTALEALGSLDPGAGLE